jgi:hypothetical protein
MEYASKMRLTNNLCLLDITIKMRFLTFNTDTDTSPVTKRRILAAAIIFQLFILSIVLISGNQQVLAENNSSETNRIDYFQFNDSNYKIPNTGVEVSLLTGWKGINLSSFILTSPGGVDAKTGEGVDKVPVFMTVGYFSPDTVFKTHNVTSLKQFVEQIAKTTKCPIADNGEVRINGFSGYKIRMNCDSNRPDVDNILNYFFTSNGKVVFLSLKGTNPYFYRNKEKFEESVNTIRAVH